MRRRDALTAAALVILAAGCHPKAPSEPPAVCVAALPAHLHHREAPEIPARQWFALLFKGYDPQRRNASDVDCTGEPLRWPAESADCTPDPQPGPRTAPLTDESLVLRHAEGAYWYAWVPYQLMDDGMAQGPFAVVRVAGDHLEARALGALRAYPTRARFEVRNVAGQHVLTARGEACLDEGSPCLAGTRLMWLDRQRFRARPLRSEGAGHACLGPAWFPARETRRVELEAPWYRVLRRSVELTYREGEIAASELITVEDHDRSHPDVPPKLFRKVEAELSIRVQQGELLTRGQSLWGTVLEQDGARSER